MAFSHFGFHEGLLQSIKDNGYTQATPIQQDVIPHILKKQDIMAQAQTGSGKTASFVLPILEHLSTYPSKKKPQVRVLVLTPTRELALQVADVFTSFSQHFPSSLKVASLIGGQSLGEQLENIQKQGCDVIVATTGRLLDILSKKQFTFESLNFFVIDEADKMLDLGFASELETLLKQLPPKRQNLLFSATYPPKMLDIAKTISTEFITVRAEGAIQNNASIKERFIEVNKDKRSALLQHLLKNQHLGKTLVFMATKRSTDNLAFKFRKKGFNAQSFHGNLDQEERILTLDEFKTQEVDILFCTDIAARGLHVNDIECVINFDLPRSALDYTHRIGRTGRAGKNGLAITFIDYEDEAHLKLIEKRCKLSIVKERIEGFERTGEALKKQKGPAPTKGKRKSKKDKLREEAALKDK